MGSPVSVVVTNLVMEKMEQEAQSTFYTPQWFLMKYMVPSDLVDSFHDHMNSNNPCIQFTMEMELDGQLLFLDILLRREDGSISTSAYYPCRYHRRLYDGFMYTRTYYKILKNRIGISDCIDSR